MNPFFVIFAEAEQASIARVRGEDVRITPLPQLPSHSTADWAALVQIALKQAGYDGSGVLLAIPSSGCLAATIPVSDLPKRSRRALMIYRFEEQLPVATEELVVDFAWNGRTPIGPSGSAQEAMGVGVVLARLTALVDALEGQGIYVQSIAPTAFLAVQQRSEGRNAAPEQSQVVIWSTHLSGSTGNAIRTFELLELREGQPMSWQTLASVECVATHLRHLHLLRGAHLQVIAEDFAEAEIRAIQSLQEIVSISNEHRRLGNGPASDSSAQAGNSALQDAAARFAGQILAGQSVPWIELRRDALAAPEPLRRIRWPLSTAIAALVFFALTAALSMLMLAQAYEGRSEKYLAIERGTFRSATGGRSPVGSDIVSQLLREDRRVAALSGTYGSADGADAARQSGTSNSFVRPRSALCMLDDVLRALPDNLRFRILEMQLSSEQLELDGQTRNHGDADAIADGLRALGGYSVDPPHSEVFGNQAVSFTIIAKPMGPQRDAPKIAEGALP